MNCDAVRANKATIKRIIMLVGAGISATTGAIIVDIRATTLQNPIDVDFSFVGYKRVIAR